MLTNPKLKSDICHEKYTNTDFHLFDKSGREDAEISKKREAKCTKSDSQETFQDFLVDDEQPNQEVDDFTEIDNFVTQNKKLGRGPSKIRRIDSTKPRKGSSKVSPEVKLSTEEEKPA